MADDSSAQDMILHRYIAVTRARKASRQCGVPLRLFCFKFFSHLRNTTVPSRVIRHCTSGDMALHPSICSRSPHRRAGIPRWVCTPEDVTTVRANSQSSIQALARRITRSCSSRLVSVEGRPLHTLGWIIHQFEHATANKCTMGNNAATLLKN
jgi:hypothetical protein